MDQEEIAIKLESMSQILIRMEHRLFGNGQPGEIQALKNRTEKVESFKDRFMGAIAILSFIVTVIGTALITHILHTH